MKITIKQLREFINERMTNDHKVKCPKCHRSVDAYDNGRSYIYSCQCGYGWELTEQLCREHFGEPIGEQPSLVGVADEEPKAKKRPTKKNGQWADHKPNINEASYHPKLSQQFTKLNTYSDYPGLIRDSVLLRSIDHGPISDETLKRLSQLNGVIIKMNIVGGDKNPELGHSGYFLFSDEKTALEALEDGKF